MRRVLWLALFILPSCETNILKAVSTSFAKEYCSCRFVVKQTDSYCREYAMQMIPISSYKVSGNEVIAHALGHKRKAVYKNEFLGCALTSNQAF